MRGPAFNLAACTRVVGPGGEMFTAIMIANVVNEVLIQEELGSG